MYSSCFGSGTANSFGRWCTIPTRAKTTSRSRASRPPRSPRLPARLRKEEAQHQPGPVGVDYIIDIPLELAASFCGYRHDMRPSGANPTSRSSPRARVPDPPRPSPSRTGPL